MIIFITLDNRHRRTAQVNELFEAWVDWQDIPPV
jgi:hypothetical protein